MKAFLWMIFFLVAIVVKCWKMLNMQLSEEEVSEYFRLLCEAGILKEIVESDYEKRYDIVNEEFRLVIISLAGIQGTSSIASNKIWNTLANPTKGDRNGIRMDMDNKGKIYI